MSKSKNYVVGPVGPKSPHQPDKAWKATKSGASRASFTGATQKEVYDKTRDSLAKNGGGEISVQGKDGKIRDKNTIGRPDKNPPKG